MEVGAGGLNQASMEFLMHLPFPGDAVAVKLIGLFIGNSLVIGKPHRNHAMLIHAEVLQVDTLELSVFLVIDAEIGFVLAVVLVHERMFIAFLIPEFQSQGGQDEAKLFLLLASHIDWIAVHVWEQGLEFAVFLL